MQSDTPTASSPATETYTREEMVFAAAVFVDDLYGEFGKRAPEDNDLAFRDFGLLSEFIHMHFPPSDA